MVLAAIPSPSTGILYVGPVPLRGYTLTIIVGIVIATVITGRRLRARGQPAYLATDVAGWAVPFGIVGARVYHVVTSPDAYFGAGGDPVDILRVWHGGLGIWGAVAGGALGVWLACRRRGVGFGLFADAAAPGLALAQAVGRVGNWFNQELYGRPTDLPWALRIDPEHQRVAGESLYHPTFLYEALWNVGVAGILLWVDRHHRLGRGKLFALYVLLYTAGRAWIEALRIDEAHTFLGVRLNDWTSLVVFAAAALALVFLRAPVDPPAAAETPADDPSAAPGPGPSPSA
ncbi:prolipoprotein diacylglyceryl transferase, partial [Candidatus Protofrankia datiscae]|uniref:prolipoprotein diacylglyceryl transferase n=2 Tax=Candidatus Protofrankia datiscae TaxID=2716812 RepID=UPI00104186BE